MCFQLLELQSIKHMWHQVNLPFKQRGIAVEYFTLRSIACNSEELSFDHPTMTS